MGLWALTQKKDALTQRARIVQTIRAFFMERGFLEVETPHRIPANAPEFHIMAQPSEGWYLHSSPELCMKRLLAAGYERLFQLCRCWRREERGSRHLPEFTMLEWYESGSNYLDLMERCEELLGKLAPSRTLEYQGASISLSPPFERLSVREAFARHASLGADEALRAGCFDELLSLEVEPKLGHSRPTFLYDYPAELAALSRKKSTDPELAERFELYVAGIELANAFSELVDADEQRRRFEQEEARRRRAGHPPCRIPERFLQEMEGMAPCAGIALGVDRLIMLLLDKVELDAVVAFPPELL